MLLPLPHGITVTVTSRTPGAPDLHGNDTWATATRQVQGCAWWPGSAGRNVAGTREYLGDREDRNQVVSRAQVVLPYGETIGSNDLVTHPDGSVWEVFGGGQQWQSQLTGANSGVQVSLERVDG